MDALKYQQEILPVVVEELDLVRVEKNLQSLGFFASTANRQISRTVVQVFRRPDGQRVHAKAVIEGVPSLGLPSTADRDKYMAFMKIVMDQREFQGQVANPIRFSGADMIRLLGLRKGGFHYDEINDWCKRMVATTIMSESSVFLADRRQYASDTFHVFDRVVLIGEELGDGVKSEFYQVYLSQWQLTNLNHGYLLPLDFNAYVRLTRDISKALFGHLSVWFYASRGQSVEKRYNDLCQLLSVRAYPHISKARAVLAPSLDELVKIKYLSSWELTRCNSADDFKLSLTPGRRLLSLPNLSAVVNADARASLESRLPGWVADLVQLGVSEKKARQLALDAPEDQPVWDQIEYAQHLIQQDLRGRGKIANPAGFVVWAVENNLRVRPDFETERKKAMRVAQQQVETEERLRGLELRNEYEQYCDEKVRARIETALSSKQVEAALAEQLRIIRKEQPDWFNRVNDDLRREVATARLRTSIRGSLNLPSFEDWASRQYQRSLF
jgi:hypothetical protein